MPYYKKPAFWLITAAAMICITVFILFSNNSKDDSSNPAASADDKKHSASFSAAIIEADEHSLLVEPVEGSAELSSSDRISIPIEYMPKSHTPKVGDIISIQYNGEIMESYPTQLWEIYDIRLIEADSGRLRYHNNQRPICSCSRPSPRKPARSGNRPQKYLPDAAPAVRYSAGSAGLSFPAAGRSLRRNEDQRSL